MAVSKKGKEEKAVNHENRDSLPIIGIGASAGGLGALKQFFKNIPEDTGFAYVVVVHLSPEHKSMLAELLQAHIKMPVAQVMRTTELKPNHVYIIPPNANLNTIDTHLRLSELEEKRSQRAPIDHFFRTLAKMHDGSAAGIILTGSGSDGTLGIKEIKEKGGLTIAQNPQEAEYDGMPQSAISTGLIDLILPVDEMASSILAYFSTKPKLPQVPGEKKVEKELQQYLNKLFTQVRARTGRDFSQYKTSTIIRRIQRRMQLNQIEEFAEYLELLRKNPEEVRTLSDDFLINVTNFFRDPEVYDYIENTLLPEIIKNKQETEQLRIWSVGCATGEEAYSLAILVQETIEKQELSVPVQIFASDLHHGSLKKAREGYFPGDIKTDISPERLKRFFIQEKGNYRIRKDIREQVIFTPHNLLGDPPFSHLDMVVCRNLLIYLKRDVQKDVFDLFHYALVPNGYLVLGPSESLENSELFSIKNKDFSVFRKKNVNGPDPRLPVFPSVTRTSHEPVRKRMTQENISFSTMHKTAVENYGPPSLLISPEYQVLHISETAGRYLMHPGGEPSRDVFKLIRKELQLELRTAIHSARDKKVMARSKPVMVIIDGQKRQVLISVRELEEETSDKSYLVFFEEYDQPLQEGIKKTDDEDSHPYISQIDKLEDELSETRQQLQAIVEEYETSREEMKASNEELQSSNEELRSTLEELETSKEELQSVNEELSTVNQENRHKVEELSMMADDLQNLLKATNIATLFLDREMRIQRFTPQLGELFNVRTTDRGRKISDITHKLGYNNLENDAQKVLKTLQPVVLESKDSDGNIYLIRLMPYRSSEDAIQGVVITFIDITESKRNEERLKKMINIEQVGVLTFSKNFETLLVNDSFLKMIGYTREEFDRKNLGWKELSPPQKTNTPQQVKSTDTGKIGPYEKEFERKDGTSIWMMFAGAEMTDGSNIIYCFDITAKKKAEEALRRSEEKYRTFFDSIDEMLCTFEVLFNKNGKPVDLLFLDANDAFNRHSGFGNAAGKRVLELEPEFEQQWLDRYAEIARSGEPKRFQKYMKSVDKWFDVYACRLGESSQNTIAFVGSDITRRKQDEANLQFLADITKDLSLLSDAGEIMETVSQKMGSYFNVSNCLFADIDEEKNQGLIEFAWKSKPELPDLSGTYRMDEFVSEAFREMARNNETIVIHNTQTDPRADAKANAALKVHSFISVPIMQSGKWCHLFIVNDNKPRNWREDEVELITETANRMVMRLNRARSEELLRQSEERLRLTLDAMEMGSWMREYDAEELFIDEENARLYGFEGGAQNVKIEQIYERMHPDDRERVRQAVKKAWELNSEYSEEFRVLVNGVEQWLSSRGKVVQDDTRKMIGINYDITERKNTEKELAVNRAQYKGLFESIDEGFCIVEMIFDKNEKPVDYRFVEVNPAFEKHTGLKNATGKTMRELEPCHEQQWFDIYGRIAKTGQPQRFQQKAYYLSDHTFDLYAFRTGQPAENKVAILFEDITQHLKDKQELKRAKDAAEKAAKIKEEFLAHMSHEIRTPLNAIMGLTYLLLEQPYEEHQKTSLTTLKTAAENLHQLINDILDYSKLKSGKWKISKEVVNLKKCIGELGMMHKSLTDAKNITLETEVENAVPERVVTDESKLLHILNNLVSNAIKFTAKGGVKVEVKLKRRKNQKLWLEFAVSDTGIGIKESQLKKIFEEFSQADPSTVKQFKGTGLGLAIVKMYLHIMDSEIFVESTPGKGSRFWFELPVKEVESDTEPSTGEEEKPSQVNMKDARVLIVEDDEFSRMMLGEMLSMWGIQHDEAVNGKEAVELAEKNRYHLILIDVHMPVMDGYEATRHLRRKETYKNAPIYAITADVSQAVTREVNNNLFTGKIIKPYDPDQIYEMIKNILAGAASR